MTGCIGHKSTHTSQLFDLFIRTSGSGVRHHVDVVILVKAGKQIVSQLIIRLFPGIDNFFITLFLRDQTTSEVLGNLVNGRLSVRNQLRFALRHSHIGNGYSHGRSRRILITDCLDII